jgi:hypothetical protein
MHPVWVIRASRAAFALRPNRESTSNVCHKRPPSIVIFHPFLLPITLYSHPFHPQPPHLRPVAAPSPPNPTILHVALFSNLAARLEESDYLATLSAASVRSLRS